ncbi:class I SAM-dependent methyltransferase [Alicyclobacillus vulcanalis]|uniref:Methyltransferase domain-containing protein n=1 Tax=Alicyclobacillus vulcanalis TaxID=252246 RepID=A0A1N7N4C4_9BACL|nr:methyltransferase domain-containing protein [Alicyclobacillus vulcanalis]SIS93184.1 Methyltransferase domain-containing protein [Alicyclobacillus vulcanalis]
MPHVFRPEHAMRLLSEERQRLLPAARVLDALDLRAPCDAVDIGAGPGYFALPLARLAQGKVYAVDLSPEMLDMLRQRAADEGVSVEAVQGSADRLPLEDHAVDRALMAFVLHEVPDREQAVREVYRVLRPGGRFLLLEWDKRPMEMGPPVEERLSVEACEAMLTSSGFRVLHRIYPNDVHYGLVAERGA